MKQRPRGLRDGAVALLVALFSLALLLATAPDIGLTWDEPFYTQAAESYVTWLAELLSHPASALSPERIQYYWEPNHNHPPLDKVWSGVVWSLGRAIFDDLTAHRLGNMLLASALVAMVFAMVSAGYGRLAGLAAAGALLTMPRFFFHAHLAALDVPAAVAVFGVVFLFWTARDRAKAWWDVLLGLAWGLALLTKINAVFVLPTLLIWVLLFQRRGYLLRRLVVMGLIAPLVYFALWPWLYYESVNRFVAYLGFQTVSHLEIGQWYLGRFWMPPPWHFAFVITLAVIPLSLLILAAIGIGRVAKAGRANALGWLFIMSAIVPILAQTTGKGMVYDNDRLFMTAFPYIAALAGFGFAWIIQAVWKLVGQPTSPVWPKLISGLIAGLVFVPHLVIAGSLYPHLLSYYSELVGGLPGATRLGFETTYWCETYAEALPYLNSQAPPGSIVWVQSGSHDVLLYYQLQGRLRSDLRIAAPLVAQNPFRSKGMQPLLAAIWDSDYVVLQYRQTGFTAEVRDWLSGRDAVYRLDYRGLPLLEIYVR